MDLNFCVCRPPPLPLQCFHGNCYLDCCEVLRENNVTKGLKFTLITEGKEINELVSLSFVLFNDTWVSVRTFGVMYNHTLFYIWFKHILSTRAYFGSSAKEAEIKVGCPFHIICSILLLSCDVVYSSKNTCDKRPLFHPTLCISYCDLIHLC